jgi:hypothetical protein
MWGMGPIIVLWLGAAKALGPRARRCQRRVPGRHTRAILLLRVCVSVGVKAVPPQYSEEKGKKGGRGALWYRACALGSAAGGRLWLTKAAARATAGGGARAIAAATTATTAAAAGVGGAVAV